MEADRPPVYSEHHFTAFVPFTNETDHDFTKQVRVSIRVPKFSGYSGPKPVYWHNPPMDTGSTGLAISARDLGYTEEGQLQSYEKGKEYLSSSRVYYEGYWVPTTVNFPDGNVTAKVKILAVTFRATCLDFNETTGSCDNHTNGVPFPLEICYMGVGFGRLISQQPGGTANNNPLLNIVRATGDTAIPEGSHRRGYVITETGLWVGLAHNNTRDFRFTKLRPVSKPEEDSAQRREWTGTDAFIEYHGSSMQGTALFDTGITQSYLSAPVFQECHRLLAGDQYTLKIGNDVDNPIETLHITVADFTNPICPPYVRVTPREPVFINTGRLFYRSFDLLFDADEGWLGLRRREGHHLPSRTPPLANENERSSRPGTERRDSDEES